MKIVTTGSGGVDYVMQRKEEFEPELSSNDNVFSYSYLIARYKNLLGQVLTMIDAAISSEKQNKAIKDIVRNTFANEMSFTADMCFNKEELDDVVEQSLSKAQKEGKVGEKSLKEVLE